MKQVPAIARALVASTAAAALTFGVAVAPASAQEALKFEFAKPEPVKTVEWKAQVKAGGLVTTGNSQADSATLGATVSRREGANKVGFDGGLAYGTTNVLTPIISNPGAPMPTIDGLERLQVATTNSWFAKARDDYFFTVNNSAYVSAQGAGDEIAGKAFYGGGQIGYSRQVYNGPKNLVVAEIGYDYSYQRYVQQPNKSIPPVSVHSARVFAGETLTLTTATGINASVEALFNLNKEDNALNHVDGTPGVDPFKDTRVIGKAGLTTTVWKSLSIAFGFTLKYTQNPAPLPIPKSAPPGSTWSPTAFAATGGTPFADTVDTLTEISLIYSFL